MGKSGMTKISINVKKKKILKNNHKFLFFDSYKFDKDSLFNLIKLNSILYVLEKPY